MKVPCKYKFCASRRIHYTQQDIERGIQYIEIEDEKKQEAYCSLTCAILDGALTIKTGSSNENN